MRKFLLATCLLALIAARAFAQDDEDEPATGVEETPDAEETPAPLLVIHKTVSESNVVLGGSVKVKTTVFNWGSAEAFDVEVTDNTPTGQKEKKADVLKGEDTLVIEYEVPAAELGRLSIGQAKATYLGSKDGAEKLTAVSNVVREEERDEKKHAQDEGERGFVNVVTAAQYEKLNTRYIKETVVFLIYAAILVVFPFMVYKQKSAAVEAHLRECRKK